VLHFPHSEDDKESEYDLNSAQRKKSICLQGLQIEFISFITHPEVAYSKVFCFG
jgi:hypothetical protein